MHVGQKYTELDTYMKNIKNQLVNLFLLLLLAGFINADSLLAADSIKIGSFLAVTGGASFLGDPELKTLQMYVDKANQKGGINGKKIELVHYDTAGNPKKAVNYIKRLIQKDRVDLIIGGSTSGTTLAVSKLLNKYKVPMISLAGSIKIIQPTQKWLFKVPQTDRMAAAKIFLDMKNQGISKVALITGSGGFDKSGRAQCLDLAPEYGIEIVADESYGNKDNDMTAQLTKIRSSNAQAILNFGFGKAPAIVSKNIKQLGIKLPIYQSHGVASKKFIELAGKAAEGIRLPSSALIVADQLAANDPQKEVIVGYKQAFEAKHGAVSAFGGYAYDGLHIALEALKRADTADSASIRDEIEKTTQFVGTGGIFNMKKNDHMGLGLDSFKILEIRNGDWHIVE